MLYVRWHNPKRTIETKTKPHIAASQRDHQRDNNFKIKAQITTIIILYLEIKALCPKRVIYHRQFWASVVTTKPIDGHVFSCVCLLVILFAVYDPCDHYQWYLGSLHHRVKLWLWLHLLPTIQRSLLSTHVQTFHCEAEANRERPVGIQLKCLLVQCIRSTLKVIKKKLYIEIINILNNLKLKLKLAP